MPLSVKSAKEIFLEAVDKRDPADRANYLRDACGADAELRRHVEALLRVHDEPDSLLDQQRIDPRVMIDREGTSNPTIDQPSERPGTQIGPYKLLQQIGEGGMGVVYMAEQSEPVKRRVALKIIKPGMDTRQVIARFEAERQALSLMDHPNIAKVLDAGTTASGRPYFVMELVKGQPITQYCDENHLTPRQRLELLLPVCQAIQHAHQKGIIHRDIKPTNILVAEYDQQPVPKVIDFGVAKATGQTLTEKTMFTGLGQIVGTLEYMSPEQAKVNQLDIDTRSDIYSLGVLLYELLTGSTPFDRKRLQSAAFDEMLRIIREEEPPKPSTRLSDSHDSLPSISAQRHTEPAKLTKLVRGELDWIVMKALEKDRNRRYETANGFAADVQRYLADEQVLACPPSATYRVKKFVRRNKGGLSVAALVLFFLVVLGSGVGWAVRDRAARKAEMVQERTNREAELTREREARQAKAGGQVESIFTEVDRLEGEQKWPEALAAARPAEAVLAGGQVDAATAERVRERLKDLVLIDRLEQIRMQQATWVGTTFDYAGADREYARAFRDYGVDVEELAVETSIDRLKARPAIAIALAAALDNWVRARMNISGSDAARWKRLVAVARGIDPEPVRDRVRATQGRPVAETQDDLRRLAESIDIRAHPPATLSMLAASLHRVNRLDAKLRLLRDAQGVYPADFWLNYGLALRLRNDKDYEGAVRFYTAAVAVRPTAVAALNDLGISLAEQGKLDEAIAAWRKATELDPKFAYGFTNLGRALRDQNKLDEAVAAYRKAIALDPKFANAYIGLGGVLHDQNKLDEAVAAYRKAIELDPKIAGAYSDLGFVLVVQKRLDEAVAACRKAIELDPKFSGAYTNLGTALTAQGQLDEAIAACRKAIELDSNNASAYSSLGMALSAQGQLDEAVAAFRKAIKLDPKNPKHTKTFYNNLGVALRRKGELDQAIAACRKAIELDPKLASAYYNLGLALHDQNKLDEAVSAYREAIELKNFANAYGGLGIALAHQKKLDEAVSAFRKAIELDPKDAKLHYNLGKFLYDELAEYDKAIESYRTAIELDPQAGYAHGGLADLLATCADPKLRDLGRAVALAKKAIELTPVADVKGQSYNWQTLGWALYRTGDWKGSVAALEKSMALQPSPKGGDSGQWFPLAMAHWQLGEKEKAREWYDRAVEWMDKNAPADKGLVRFGAEAAELLNVGPEGAAEWDRRLLEALPAELPAERQRGWERELAALSDEIRAKPDDPAPLARRARLHVRSGRFEQAMPDLDRLVQLDPAEHLHWMLRGCLLAYLGDEKGYRRHCEAMLRQFADATDKYILDRTTKAALLLPGGAGGDVQMLAQRAEKTYTLDPKEPWFAMLRGIADYRADRLDSAIQWLTKARETDFASFTIAVDAYLAMAHHRRDQPAEARAALDRCIQRLEKDLPVAGQADLDEKDTPENWLIAHVARREAEQLLAK
ncbi:MAG: tetratricopeptide repeat protein [Pirellulaceae bacterium]